MPTSSVQYAARGRGAKRLCVAVMATAGGALLGRDLTGLDELLDGIHRRATSSSERTYASRAGGPSCENAVLCVGNARVRSCTARLPCSVTLITTERNTLPSTLYDRATTAARGRALTHLLVVKPVVLPRTEMQPPVSLTGARHRELCPLVVRLLSPRLDNLAVCAHLHNYLVLALPSPPTRIIAKARSIVVRLVYTLRVSLMAIIAQPRKHNPLVWPTATAYPCQGHRIHRRRESTRPHRSIFTTSCTAHKHTTLTSSIASMVLLPNEMTGRRTIYVSPTLELPRCTVDDLTTIRTWSCFTAAGQRAERTDFAQALEMILLHHSRWTTIPNLAATCSTIDDCPFTGAFSGTTRCPPCFRTFRVIGATIAARFTPRDQIQRVGTRGPTTSYRFCPRIVTFFSSTPIRAKSAWIAKGGKVDCLTTHDTWTLQALLRANVAVPAIWLADN